MVQGVREVRESLIEGVALVPAGSYDQARAEVRDHGPGGTAGDGCNADGRSADASASGPAKTEQTAVPAAAGCGQGSRLPIRATCAQRCLLTKR